MIAKVSEGFWRSDDGRFDVLEVRKPRMRGGVVGPCPVFVVYDCDLGKRYEFMTIDEVVSRCESATHPPTPAA